MAGDVGVVGLRGDRRRGVAADAREHGEVVGPAVGGDDHAPLPTAGARGAGTRAVPTP